MLLLLVRNKKVRFLISLIVLKYFIEGKTLSRTDSDMSSSGYSEYRSDSWVEDDHTNKSTTMKRDKRSEFDRYIFCYNYLIKHFIVILFYIF